MRARGVFASAGLLFLAACGGDTPAAPPPPTPTPTPRAVIKILLDPKPVVATPSGDSNYPWAMAVNLQVSDSGGVAFSVTSMQSTLTAASTGQVIGSTDQNAFVGVKIPALGQATRQFTASYRMDANKTKEGTFSVRMNFVDDNGFASVGDASATIQNLGEVVELPAHP